MVLTVIVLIVTARLPGMIVRQQEDVSALARRVRRIVLKRRRIAVFVVSAFPVYWMISTAFKPNQEIFSIDAAPGALHPTLHHFDFVLNGGIAGVSFWHYFVNSPILALGTVVVVAGCSRCWRRPRWRGSASGSARPS